MEETTNKINAINTKINEIKLLLKKPLKCWTEEEKKEFGDEEQLRMMKMQLRAEEMQLKERKSLLLKEEAKQRKLVILEKDLALSKRPKLGDENMGLYDVFSHITGWEDCSTSEYDMTTKVCHLSIEPIAEPLSLEEQSAILEYPSELWRSADEHAAPYGKSPYNINEYVQLVTSSVIGALKLNFTFENHVPTSKSFEHDFRYLVICSDAGFIGCFNNKLPIEYQNPPVELKDSPFLTHQNKFLVEMHDQMMEMSTYYGARQVFGIGSTGREWCFYKLPSNESNNYQEWLMEQGQVESNYSFEIPRIHYSEYEADLKEDAIQPLKELKLLGTKVYQWNDKEMLFMLGAVLKQMSLAKKMPKPEFGLELVDKTSRWHFFKTETKHPWGWAKFSVPKLHYNCMIDPDNTEVVLLHLLGKGTDGIVFLVANQKGHVAAMKLIEDLEDAQRDAQNWNEIYKDFCLQFHWSIRCEHWMGIPSVIMPLINQFTSRKDRIKHLDDVRERLEHFHAMGYVHYSIKWRNVGHFTVKGKIVVIMLDMTKVFKSEKDRSWIDIGMKRLEQRA